MTDIQVWSIIVAVIGTLGGHQIVTHFLNRGKFRSDDAASLRAELRADNKEKDAKIRALEQRIDELETVVDRFRMLRLDTYQILQENNVSQDVLTKIRILEAR